MLFLMEIILPNGLEPCVVISKAASCGFMSLVTVLFQNKWTKKLILPMPFGLRIGKVLIICNNQIIDIQEENSNTMTRPS